VVLADAGVMPDDHPGVVTVISSISHLDDLAVERVNGDADA
jgi:hypothetical protein